MSRGAPMPPTGYSPRSAVSHFAIRAFERLGGASVVKAMLTEPGALAVSRLSTATNAAQASFWASKVMQAGAQTKPYKSPQDVMDAMKNGELDVQTGNRMLQGMQGNQPVQPLAPPPPQ